MGSTPQSHSHGRNSMATTKSDKKPKPMPKKQLQHFEKRLLEERRRVLKELGHHGELFNKSEQASDGDLSAYSFHMADQGTDAMEREKAFLFASQEGHFLWHIDEALRRLYRAPESFGKWLAVRALVPQRLPHEVFGDAVRLTLVYNPGAAFGLHLGPLSRWIFMALT